MGYRYLETDVRATRDGSCWRSTTPHLDRVTDSPGRLADLEYAEVATALVGGQEPILRMVRPAGAFPHARFNIAPQSVRAIEPLVELVVRRASRNASASPRSRTDLRAFLSRMRAQLVGPGRHGCGVFAATAMAVLPLGRAGGDLPALLRDTGGTSRCLTGTRAAGRGDRTFVAEAHASDDTCTLYDRRAGGDGAAAGPRGGRHVTDRTDVLRDVLVARGRWDTHG